MPEIALGLYPIINIIYWTVKDHCKGGHMVQLNLSPEEQEALIEVLTDCISDLRMEIADTDKQDFREEIKVRKELLKKVVDALEQ